ncbi:hypothetical protein DPSP01_006016 [Paraphaeosphaeria sporulosa]
MAKPSPSTDRTDATATALTHADSGRLLHVSLPFINDLISLLSTLASSFEGDLARISSEQRVAECEDNEAAPEKKRLVISAECEEYLREAMLKLHTNEKEEYDNLVKKYPGTDGIIGTTDPRHNEAAVLGERVNML